MFTKQTYYKTRSGRVVGARIEWDKVIMGILVVGIMAAVVTGGVLVN